LAEVNHKLATYRQALNGIHGRAMETVCKEDVLEAGVIVLTRLYPNSIAEIERLKVEIRS